MPSEFISDISDDLLHTEKPQTSQDKDTEKVVYLDW
jgi:hypothetical protein